MSELVTLTDSVLVTGGTGSLGQALVARLLQDPVIRRLRVYSRDELKQAEMRERFPDPRLQFFLGDVRDRMRLAEACHRVSAVVNCAALKRVDALAYNPEEALKTNVLGTLNVVKAAIETGVGRVIVISSDKAVEPINHYGMTKGLAETLAIRANARGVPCGTRIAVVRYGNVMASRGSVVGIFRRALAEKRPLPVTDPLCTRFWLTLADAVDLVRWTLLRLRGGEVVVPVLPALLLDDLAAAMNADADIDIIGLRAGGEKLHESLLNEDEQRRAVLVGSERIVINPDAPSWAYEPWTGGRPPWPYRSDRVRRLSVEEIRAMVAAL